MGIVAKPFGILYWYILQAKLTVAYMNEAWRRYIDGECPIVDLIRRYKI